MNKTNIKYFLRLENKLHLSFFFAFRINSFCEKALDLQTLIGKFALNISPDFEASQNN